MERAVPIALLVGFALGLGVGWVVAPTASVESSPAPPPPPPARTASQTGAPAPPSPSTAPADCPSVADLEFDLREQEALVETLEIELYGEPLEWTEEIPDLQREEAFVETMDAVVAECNPDWSVSEVRCDEPPCMAVVWGPGNGVGGCDAWSERYGIASSSSSATVDCGDGRSERVLILSPPPRVYANVDEMMGDDSIDPVDRENRSKRMMARWQRLQRETPCPPASPTP